MNENYLRAAKMILVGSVIGGVLAWLIRPPLIGLTLRIAIGVKIGDIINWREGVKYGATIGLIAGASIALFASVTDTLLVDLIVFGILG
ncbi:MAG: hypothetical protein CL608_01895 [Anaerolineaceae bacterium]|nr:hypothetical protein [Anaerolineaceae bacterium]